MERMMDTHIEIPVTVKYDVEPPDPSVGFRGGIFISGYEINGIDLTDYRCGNFGLVAQFIQKLGRAIMEKNWDNVDMYFNDVEREHKNLRIGPTLFSKLESTLEEWAYTGEDDIREYLEEPDEAA